MSIELLMRTVQRLNASAEALAALGAELRLQQDDVAGDPRIRAILKDVVNALDLTLLDGVNAGQRAAVVGGIQAFFRQAIDLLEQPARPPGWGYDPTVLQAQGRLSRVIAHEIERISASRPDLHATLRGPGAFLDVGTGVAWLAIEAARIWPSMNVVGIDPWETALKLARENVAGSDVADRVELRAQGAEGLEDREAFTLAWMAGPFLPPDIVPDAIGRVARALKPGGWLVFGLYPSPSDPLGQALAALRVVRSGGHPWQPEEIEDRFRALGFEQVETVATNSPVLPVIGRRPVG
jgi:SAM-dependent methyltransferase